MTALEQSVRRRIAADLRAQAEAADHDSAMFATTGDAVRAEEQRIAARLLRWLAGAMEP